MNHNNSGRTPSTYPTRPIAHPCVNNNILSTLFQHRDCIGLESDHKKNDNNTPRYLPKSGFVLDSSPRGSHTPFTQHAHHAVAPTVFPQYGYPGRDIERPHNYYKDARYLPSSKLGLGLCAPCKQPLYPTSAALHKHILLAHRIPSSDLVAQALSIRVYESNPAFPPGLGARTKNSLIARDAHLPVPKFDPFSDDESSVPNPQPYKDSVPALVYPPWAQVLRNAHWGAAPVQTQKPGFALAPLAPPTRINSQVLNTIKARARSYRPSSRFNPFGDESEECNQPQADSKVPVVPVNLVESSSVLNSQLCDNPVFAALYAPWRQLHLVGLPRESPESPGGSSPGSDSECPVLSNGSDSQWGTTPAPVFTSTPFTLNVRSPKLPGPFMVAKELQSGAFGQAVAVYELGILMQPHVLCLKVFRKRTVSEYNLLEGIKTELQAYRRLEEAQPFKDFVFLMKIDAALQDDTYLYFAMVRSQRDMSPCNCIHPLRLQDLMRCDLAGAIHSQEHKEHTARWMAQIVRCVLLLIIPNLNLSFPSRLWPSLRSTI